MLKSRLFQEVILDEVTSAVSPQRVDILFVLVCMLYCFASVLKLFHFCIVCCQLHYNLLRAETVCFYSTAFSTRVMNEVGLTLVYQAIDKGTP